MTSIWALAALWLGLALVASLLSIWLRVSTALSEIVVGTDRPADHRRGDRRGRPRHRRVLGQVPVRHRRHRADLPRRRRARSRPSSGANGRRPTAIGLVGFFAALPRLRRRGLLAARLGASMPSWLAGVALSTTSVAVVYAVMLEFGFNTTDYGKTVLAACFINDLGTVRRARPHLRAVHHEDADLRRRRHRRRCRAALAHAALLPALRRPAVRARSQIPAALPVRHGRARGLGRQRGRASRLSSSAWCSPAPSARIMRSSAGCARSPSAS